MSQAALSVITASKLTRVYQDNGTGANKDLAVFQADLATIPDNYYMIGQIAVPFHTNMLPESSVFLVAPLRYEEVIKPPVGYNLFWKDVGTGGSQDGSFWQVVPPVGYVALGDVACDGYNQPSEEFTKKFACIREDLVLPGLLNDDPLWTDKVSGGKTDVSLWRVENGVHGPYGLAGFFKVQPNYNKPANQVFVLPVKVTKR